VESHRSQSKSQKRVLLLLVLTAGVILVTALVIGLYRKKQVEAFRIGAILPMSGDAKSYGPWMKNGMTIAQQHVNSNKELPQPIEVIFVDSETSAETGERGFKRLVDVDHVDAVVTTTTPVTKTLIPLADQRGIILFTSATAPGLVDGSQWAFRNASNIRDEVERLMHVAQSDLGVKKISLIYLNNAVGQWLDGNFRQLAGSQGMTVVESVSFEKGDTDFHAQIQKIKAAAPDAVYLYGYNELGLLAKQMRELGVNTQLLGGLDMELPEFIQVGKNAVEGAIYTKSEYDVSNPDPLSHHFVSDYKAAFGSDPDVYSAVHYDMVMILSRAFKEAGHDKERMRQAILSIVGFNGASGLTSFGASRDASKPITVKVIRNGQHLSYSKER
jgi:branched-chain amino acid transport system substrate-binding protein